jgi:hypothetical protein
MSVGEPLHFLTEDGELESFGGEGGVFRGNIDLLKITATDRFVWTVVEREYRVAQWDITRRERTKLFEVSAAWFEDDAFEAFPRSLVMGITYDVSEPLLWIVGRAPDSVWHERWYPDRDVSRPIPNDRRAVWDGIIDVLDPETGVRLAHTRVDDELIGVIPGTSLVARYREDEMGIPYVDFLQPRHSPPS